MRNLYFCVCCVLQPNVILRFARMLSGVLDFVQIRYISKASVLRFGCWLAVLTSTSFQGIRVNDDLRDKKEFRNPGILELLMDRYNIHETGSLPNLNI
jgi:hypothetical protein